MREWLLAALGACLCWGGWSLLPKLTTKYMSPQSAIIYQVGGGILVALIALSRLNYQIEGNPKGILFALTGGILEVLGILLYIQAVSAGGNVSLVSAISALYPIITVLLAYSLLGEVITLKQGIGITLALLAVVLIVG